VVLKKEFGIDHLLPVVGSIPPGPTTNNLNNIVQRGKSRGGMGVKPSKGK